MPLTAFRAVLLLAGIFVVFLGLNVALGGVPTMKWLGERDFVAITDEAQYRLIDNHIRFFGGLFAASGLFLIFAASDPIGYRQAILLVFGLVFAGGLARFSAPDISIVVDQKIVGSLAAELVLMPVLAFWLIRLQRRQSPAGGR